MPGPVTYKEVTIANAASLSSEADLTGHQLIAIQMPDDWDAADLTFQARPGCADDVAAHPNELLQNLYDDQGNEVTVQADADRYIALTAGVLDALTGCGAIKVRSGPASAAVAQTPARIITLVLVPIT